LLPAVHRQTRPAVARVSTEDQNPAKQPAAGDVFSS
jgi:hypothetical protein